MKRIAFITTLLLAACGQSGTEQETVSAPTAVSASANASAPAATNAPQWQIVGEVNSRFRYRWCPKKYAACFLVIN